MIKNQLAARLRLLRCENKMTQGEVASEIKIPRGTYAHYELGKRTPDVDMIIQLARLFNVTVDYLVGNSDLREVPLPDIAPNSDYGAGEIGAAKVAEDPVEKDKYK